MARDYLHLRSKLFNNPLCIAKTKLDDILSVVGPRLNLANAPTRSTLAPAMSGGLGLTVSTKLYVIPVHGTLVNRMAGVDAMSGLTSYEELTTLIRTAVMDPSATAIVLDIDSYGGEAAGMFDLSTLIRTWRDTKPIYAVINSASDSAGYGIASAATKIIAMGDAEIGSIGVVACHTDQSKNNEQEGYVVTYVFAGSHKIDFNPDQPLTAEQVSWLQNRVDSTYSKFVSLVAQNRGLTEDAVRATQAAVYSSDEAKQLGLIDEIMPATDAIPFIMNEVNRMSDQQIAQPTTQPAATVQPTAPITANVVDFEAAKSQAVAEATARAADNASAISEMCSAIGKPQLAAGLIKERLTAEQAKAKLFDQLAASGEKLPIDNTISNPIAAEVDEGVSLMTNAMRTMNAKGAK